MLSAVRSLNYYLQLLTGSALTPGVIAVIQTFGDRINLHPYLYFLVTEGGVERARQVDKWKTLLDNGAVLAWGTDWPVSSLNPMENLYQLVLTEIYELSGIII